MNHLFIIFSENDKLKAHCEQLVDKTYADILMSDARLCFLNGKQVHLPLKKGNIDIEESGILLVYDAHNNSAHDKGKTLSAIKRISEKYTHLYVCYHARSLTEWEEKIENLGIKLSKKHIVKSHPEEPYSFLHEFHEGIKTIEDLIEFWHQEENKENEKENKRLIDKLYYKLQEAKHTNDISPLDELQTLVNESNLSESKKKEYDRLKRMVTKGADHSEFIETLNNFRKPKSIE